MRTRTRTFTPPVGCTLTGLSETIIDVPAPSKTWKECQHTCHRVLSFTPGSGSRTTTYDPVFGLPPVTEDITPSVRNFPGYTWTVGEWRGYVTESLDVPSSDLSLPNVDLASTALKLSRSSTNVAELIATLGSTTALFSVPGKFLKHAARNGVPVTRRPLKELKASLDTAGSTWLQGTYGYMPLISDLQELSAICRAPQQALDRLKKPLKQDIRDSTSRSYSSRRAPGTPNTYFSTNVRVHETLSRLVRLEGQPSPSFQSMSLAGQMATYLGLRDYGRLAWELVPFSFVFDWFSRLGASVSSAQVLNGPLAYTNLRASSLQKTRTVTTYGCTAAPKTTIRNDWFRNTASINIVGPSCVTETIQYRRTPFGEADLSGSLFDFGLSAYRTATGVALLHGSAKRLTGW